MGFIELFLIAVSLSMDAFAVSLCKGLNMKRLNMKNAMVIGLFFGGFQAAMPLIGWYCGRVFEKFINRYDHWVAFILLTLIGVKMIIDVLKDDGEENEKSCDRLNIKELFALAVATSIDALAVGISFAFVSVNIVTAVSLIGCVTFLLSFLGVAIGHRFGVKYKDKAALCGGIVLIIIGTKILIEGLM